MSEDIVAELDRWIVGRKGTFDEARETFEHARNAIVALRERMNTEETLALMASARHAALEEAACLIDRDNERQQVPWLDDLATAIRALKEKK